MSETEETNLENNKRPVPDVYFRTSTGRSSTDLVMDHIIDGILEGKLVPGQRINANALCKSLDVSVVPVREAIHFLAGEGVIELLPLKGARIHEMDTAEIVDWWRIFRVISGLGFAACARAISSRPEQAQRIEQALQRLEHAQVAEPPLRFIMSLADFHRVVHSIGTKPVLDDALRKLQVLFWCSFLPQYIPFDDYGKYFAEHYRVVGEALIRGDEDTATSAFKHHVEWSSSIIRGARPVPGNPWNQAVSDHS